MLIWGRGFRQCGRPPYRWISFLSTLLQFSRLLPPWWPFPGMCSGRRRSALTLDLRWGPLDMLHFPVATEVVSGGAAVRRVGLRYSTYRLFGAMQTFLQSLYRRCWSTEQRPGRRFGGAGAPSGSALSRPAPALGRLAGPGAPKFAEQDRYAATRSYVRQAPRGLRACAPRAVCVSRACRHSPSAS